MYFPIFVLVGLLSIMSGMPMLSSGSITNYANAKYAPNTQTQANNNDCTTGANCGIISPQTQGDGTAISPTNLQISKFNEQQDGIGDGTPIGAMLTVKKLVICPPGLNEVCPKPNEFRLLLTFSVSEDRFFVAIPGSTRGQQLVIPVSILPSEYTIEELENPPTPEGLVLVQSTSGDCQGIFNIGDRLICTFTNEYRVAPTN